MIVWGGNDTSGRFQHWWQVQCRHGQLDTDDDGQCTLGPRLSHRGVDRQRNDRLGWNCDQRPRSKHRRNLLRAIWSNFHTHTHTHTHGTNTYANSHCDTESNSNADAYGYTYTNAYTNANIDAYTYSQTGHAWKHFDSVTSRNQ